jgi:hypothetical protein
LCNEKSLKVFDLIEKYFAAERKWAEFEACCLSRALIIRVTPKMMTATTREVEYDVDF